MKPIDVSKLNEALQLLNEQLILIDAPATEIVVCGGYHVSDLKALNPSEEELIAAARWCMTQDTSEAFQMILKDMFKQLGWQNVSEQI